jgi:hypothetical protein
VCAAKLDSELPLSPRWPNSPYFLLARAPLLLID